VFYRNAIAQKVVDVLVSRVQAAIVMVCLRLQCCDGSIDLVGMVSASNEEWDQQMRFDVAVAIAILPVTKIASVEFIAK